jgi:hypothetical protein
VNWREVRPCPTRQPIRVFAVVVVWVATASEPIDNAAEDVRAIRSQDGGLRGRGMGDLPRVVM